MLIEFTLNGKSIKLETQPNTSLLNVLREELQITSVKNGCGIGSCGSCTVVINGRAVRSCNTPVEKVQGSKIITIEGIISGNKLHPIQQAFIDYGALQCGFCTPAMIMSVYALLQKKSNPSVDEIIKAINPVLCRCTGYIQIVDAVKAVVHGKYG